MSNGPVGAKGGPKGGSVVSGTPKMPQRVTIKDPKLLEFIDVLREKGRDGTYVVICNNGRVVWFKKVEDLVVIPAKKVV